MLGTILPLGQISAYANGAFEYSVPNPSVGMVSGADTGWADIRLTASRSNSIYGASLKVQPRSAYALMIIKN